MPMIHSERNVDFNLLYQVNKNNESSFEFSIWLHILATSKALFLPTNWSVISVPIKKKSHYKLNSHWKLELLLNCTIEERFDETKCPPFTKLSLLLKDLKLFLWIDRSNQNKSKICFHYKKWERSSMVPIIDGSNVDWLPVTKRVY
jgi:hypothetical protein